MQVSKYVHYIYIYGYVPTMIGDMIGLAIDIISNGDSPLPLNSKLVKSQFGNESSIVNTSAAKTEDLT